ncbi:MAG: shikimate kinase [Acidimicrobiaceae bacterium]|nr:shikimate kinase [Acidimicrobiaceae bacterium]
MSRLVLVGLPGAGKSSVARALADHWTCSWVDTDDLIVEETASAPADVLRERGEPVFRDLEAAALERALRTDAVVATGGGVVERERSREMLKKIPTIWLDCSDEVILGRLGAGDRPLMAHDAPQTLKRLRATRERWYREVSLARVESSGTLEDVIGLIEAALTRARS